MDFRQKCKGVCNGERLTFENKRKKLTLQITDIYKNLTQDNDVLVSFILKKKSFAKYNEMVAQTVDRRRHIKNSTTHGIHKFFQIRFITGPEQ